jgi:4a-hydroxytetrahydrobiopterin dehydratase
MIHPLTGLPGWEQQDNYLVKHFEFKNFSAAFAFLTRVALLSETQQHHPDWSGVYNKVTLRLTTHDEGGITEKDIIFARQVELF